MFAAFFKADATKSPILVPEMTAFTIENSYIYTQKKERFLLQCRNRLMF